MMAKKHSAIEEAADSRPLSMVKQRRNLVSVKSNRPVIGHMNELLISNNRFTHEEPVLDAEQACANVNIMNIYEEPRENITDIHINENIYVKDASALGSH